MNKRQKFIYNSIKKNFKIWLKFIFKSKEHLAGNRFIISNSSQVIETINKVFESYKSFGGIENKDLKNKKVLEIGPGDSFGVALKFLFSGAKSIICFDKFYAKRNLPLMKEAYLTLFNSQKIYSFNEVFDKDLLPNKKIKYYFGKGFENIRIDSRNFEKESCDYIVSNQVIQEIYNPFPALKKMIRLLKKNGKMIHYIDFEPYNYFRFHLDKEYDYLTFPEYQYKWMVNKRGMGNRKRITKYIKFLENENDINFKFIVNNCFLNLEKLSEPVKYPNFPKNIKETFIKKFTSNSQVDKLKTFIKKIS
jgi:SAM-dependent methyltransferase